ncbi:hypothetical protein IG631_09555 [Alternaria alternata]|nr:hypothetical protein IG631_09555 [Alternaria alternata]
MPTHLRGSRFNHAKETQTNQPGKAHVDEYSDAAEVRHISKWFPTKADANLEFPAAPIHSVDEVVYVRTHNQVPDGPLVVVAIEEGNMYKLIWEVNGSDYHCLVPESCLLVLSA